MALCVLCHDRPAQLRDLLDSARGHSFDEIVVVDMASDPTLEVQPDATMWTRRESNLGCPAGRNELMSLSSADVALFVDDDAVLMGTGDYAEILRDFFDAMPNVGAVAGLIRRGDGHIERHEFPFPGKPARIMKARRAGCVVGACTAFRRCAFEEANGFDSTFFYSTEELDICTRLHQSGWDIWFLPDLLIEHRPAEQGRVPATHLLTFRLRNRIIYCRRSLPWPAAVVHGLIWTGIIGRDAFRTHAIKGWKDGRAEGIRTPVLRQPLSRSEARELHRLGGRVWL